MCRCRKYSPHTKGWAFQPTIHRRAQIYTITPLYCMSGCMADSKELILRDVIMSLSQAWHVFAFFRCIHLELHFTCIWFWFRPLTIFTLRRDRGSFVKWHWPIYSHVCCRDTHGRTNTDLSLSTLMENIKVWTANSLFLTSYDCYDVNIPIPRVWRHDYIYTNSIAWISL